LDIVCVSLRSAIRRTVVAGLLLCGLLAGAGPASAATTYPSLFGTREIASSNLKLFPKWRGVVDRFAEEKQGCASPLCDHEYWKKVLDDLADADRMTQIDTINREMNEKLYVIDPINWGVPDYWATPFQFRRKNGDCEDYAIAKFMALRALGFDNPEMRIVVLNDLNLGIAHAILVVYVDGQALVLDNQIKSVVPADTIRHYQPVYSVNENGWWLHRP
ncbi:MAG: transglutaminase-like cysteine peptidase, partial [Geminicoccales bacterium]